MGKENYTTEVHHKAPTETRRPVANNSASISLLKTEADSLWMARDGMVSHLQLKEDGQVCVIVREQGTDSHFSYGGFATEGNRALAIIPHLLKAGLISPHTCIHNLLVCKDHMWCHADIRTSLFNAGDSLLLIIGNPPPHTKSRQLSQGPSQNKGQSQSSPGLEMKQTTLVKHTIRKCLHA